MSDPFRLAPARPDAPSSTPPSGGFVVGTPGRPPRRPVGTMAVAGAVVGVVLATAVAFFLLNGGGPTGPAVALALDFRKGQTFRYTLSATMDATISNETTGQQEPGAVTLSGPLSMRVLHVAPNGVATVRMVIGPIDGTVAGQAIHDERSSQVVRIDRDGAVVSGGVSFLSGEPGGGAQSLPGVDQLTPLLPDHPVRQGESWDTSETRAIPGLGGVKLTVEAHSTFERTEVVDGVSTMVVRTQAHVPFDISVDLARFAARISPNDPRLASLPAGARIAYGGSMDFDFTSWVGRVDRQLERMQGTATFDLSFKGEYDGRTIPQAAFSFSGTMNVDLERR